MKCARTEGGHDSYNGHFECLEEREEGEGDDGGVGNGIPNSDFCGIDGWYRAGSGKEAEGKDDEGGEELHVGNGVVVEDGEDVVE
jgi:hypothetical protein